MTLTAELGEVVERIVVDDKALTASVAGRELTAESRTELRSRLRHAIYEVFHQGRAEENEEQLSLRDPALEKDFADAIPFPETTAEAVLLELREDSALVELSGVVVDVPRSVLRGTGERVELGLPPGRPALSPGFFLAQGSRGTGSEQQVLRVYVHLTDAASAVQVWREALAHLETRDICYYAKVLSVAALYPRQDALVVYLPANAEGTAGSLAERVSPLPGVGASTSPFAHRLAPGVATAWEPTQTPGARRLSFGEHRAQAVADGLLEHAAEPGTRLADKIALACERAGFDPLAPGGAH
ncbi:T3SS effector HopA1 family protein [Allokutzneria sp. NRRL B-24872]|uniref:T3SS effector HopA1 family protein n=1 Tax=Allokutzneria sp. NRRL B-24872 TaxID=1137961 RepID=UPI000A3C69FB|nr:T3SS effector HopA1 family protein [Allokutzneria sp. NRRL B-24872]